MRNQERQGYKARVISVHSILALCAGGLVCACSMQNPQGTKSISISFPTNNSAIPNDLSSRLMPYGTASGSTSTATPNPTPTSTYTSIPAPSSLSGFTCFGVNVSASDIPPQPGINCNNSSTPVGVIGGFIPINSGSLTLNVPTGAGRVVQLFAVVSEDGTCPDAVALINSGATMQNIGQPYLLGQATVNMSTDQSVTITANYDPSTATQLFEGCDVNQPAPTGSQPPTGNPSPSPSSSPQPVAYSTYSNMTLGTNNSTADGSTADTTVVTLNDVNDQPLAGVYPVASVTNGTVSCSPTNAEGQSTCSVTTTVAGTVTLTISGPFQTDYGLVLNLNFVAGPAAQLAFSGLPSTISQSTTLGGSAALIAEDAYGNFVSSESGTVGFSLYSNSGCTTSSSITAYSTPSIMSNGSASMTNTMFNMAGTVYISTNVSGLSTCIGPITIQ